MTKLYSRLLAAAAVVSVVAIGSSIPLPAAENAPAARPGAQAPVFTAKDINGRDVSLRDYLGKTVILEWTNDGCPFVGKHYNSGNMQELQRRFTTAGDVWLTIASSAPGVWYVPQSLAPAMNIDGTSMLRLEKVRNSASVLGSVPRRTR